MVTITVPIIRMTCKNFYITFRKRKCQHITAVPLWFKRVSVKLKFPEKQAVLHCFQQRTLCNQLAYFMPQSKAQLLNNPGLFTTKWECIPFKLTRSSVCLKFGKFCWNINVHHKYFFISNCFKWHSTVTES